MRIKLKTKAEKKEAAGSRRRQLAQWHDHFCLWPCWFDGGFAWLSWVERRQWKHCDRHSREVRECEESDYRIQLYCEVSTKTAYRFPTTLQVRSK